MICEAEREYLERHGPARHAETAAVIDVCMDHACRPCLGGECDEGSRCERHARTPDVAGRLVRLRSRAFARLVGICREYLRAAPHSAEELRLGAEINRYRESFREQALDRALTIDWPGVTWRGRRA